jgi:hypothetical protein
LADLAQTFLKKTFLFSKPHYLPFGLSALLAKLVLFLKNAFGFILARGELADTVMTEVLLAAFVGRGEDISHT